jgi:PAS domain S-box-containing protein
MKLIREADGSPSEFIGSRYDITERKLMEESLRKSDLAGQAILHASTQAILELDPQGIALSLNDTTAYRFGKKREEILGTCIYDYFPPEAAVNRKTQIDSVFKTGQPIFFVDDRQGHWFENNIYPIFDTSGKLTRVVVYAQEIT